MLIRPALAGDTPAVHRLLEDASLPLDGLPDDFGNQRDFLVADTGDAVRGAIGLERYGDSALLRSAVVAPALRGTGLGAQLVHALLEHARATGIRELVLLTTTAEHWFPRFGFARITRAEVPEAMHASAELQGACPATAVVMKLSLG